VVINSSETEGEESKSGNRDPRVIFYRRSEVGTFYESGYGANLPVAEFVVFDNVNSNLLQFLFNSEFYLKN